MDNAGWKRIQQLRQSYLDAQNYLPDYWQDNDLLSAYDETLAQRIRWKWRSVLNTLPVGLQSLPPTIVDWGCGTGGASRELLGRDGAIFDKVYLSDRSTLAMAFAARKVKAEFPEVAVEHSLKTLREPFLLLISHVLSELPDSELGSLTALARKATAILWVEAGRPLESRRLSGIRESLVSTHIFLAPCPHQANCGMLRPGQEGNWCHFKAEVPREVHHSAFWRECSKQLGFDLRSLPVAYLFAQEKTVGQAIPDDDLLQILAGSKQFKGYTRFHACHKSGVIQGDFMKRFSKSTYKELAEPSLDSRYKWQALMANEGSDESL